MIQYTVTHTANYDEKVNDATMITLIRFNSCISRTLLFDFFI